MAILKYFLQFTLVCLLAVSTIAVANNSDFIVLCYHEVESDKTPTLANTAVRASDLAAQFAWLQANGYHPVSLQQIIDSRSKAIPLPEKAILLTFDDGKKDVYTRVFPLLKLFKFPAVVALVGNWLETPENVMVDYDGKPMPRSEFVTWEEVRKMQHSGLVEIASHSYNLHQGVIANPQGNTQAAATTRIYKDGVYESDEIYLNRLREDLTKNRDLISQKTGIAPRTIVWPYGRNNVAAQQLATKLGMMVGMTLADGVNTSSTPLPVMKRYLIEGSPSLQSFAEAMRQIWSPDPLRSVKITPEKWPLMEEGLSLTLDRLQRLSINVAFVHPLVKHGSEESVLFPTMQKPLASDELNHISWQIERRTGTPVFIDIPAAWLKNDALLSDLARYVNFAGIRIPTEPGDAAAIHAISVIETWCWPLQIAYSPTGPLSRNAWQKLRQGDLIVLPATISNITTTSTREAENVLFEFNSSMQSPADIASGMQSLEAKGFRQFGVDSYPDTGFDSVWRILSLRSQPLLP